MSSEKLDAVGGQVERRVMPAAWRRVSSISGQSHGVFETQDVELRSEHLEPLYALPNGWQLMPKEPTPEMLDALRTGSCKDFPSDELCRVRYAALMAAITRHNVELRRGSEDATMESGGCCGSGSAQG